jgi:hypothetical protein
MLRSKPVLPRPVTQNHLAMLAELMLLERQVRPDITEDVEVKRRHPCIPQLHDDDEYI